MENKEMSIKDYLPSKNQLRLNCGTILVYLKMESLGSVLHILAYILKFCEDDKDLMELDRFLKYCSTQDEFSKDFYDKYSCLLSRRGMEIVDDLLITYDFDGILDEFEKESLKNTNLNKKKLLVKDNKNEFKD